MARSLYVRATATVVDAITLLFSDELRNIMALLALQSGACAAARAANGADWRDCRDTAVQEPARRSADERAAHVPLRTARSRRRRAAPRRRARRAPSRARRRGETLSSCLGVRRQRAARRRARVTGRHARHGARQAIERRQTRDEQVDKQFVVAQRQTVDDRRCCANAVGRRASSAHTSRPFDRQPCVAPSTPWLLSSSLSSLPLSSSSLPSALTMRHSVR